VGGGGGGGGGGCGGARGVVGVEMCGVQVSLMRLRWRGTASTLAGRRAGGGCVAAHTLFSACFGQISTITMTEDPFSQYWFGSKEHRLGAPNQRPEG